VRVLLDTHALLWWLFDDPKLPKAARDVIKRPDNEVLVSSASAWEIATKHRLGKLPEAEEAARDLPRLLWVARLEVLPITLEHALLAGALPGPHRDPFDRMLIAQAQLEKMPVVTADPAFKRYGIELVW
jgi:PIN domain nuclease of toxin-antitoxin system